MKTWYSDNSAKLVYSELKIALADFQANTMPNYELSHVGITEPNFDSEEIVIMLHFNKKGLIKISPEKDVFQAIANRKDGE